MAKKAHKIMGPDGRYDILPESAAVPDHVVLDGRTYVQAPIQLWWEVDEFVASRKCWTPVKWTAKRYNPSSGYF